MKEPAYRSVRGGAGSSHVPRYSVIHGSANMIPNTQPIIKYLCKEPRQQGCNKGKQKPIAVQFIPFRKINSHFSAQRGIGYV